MLQKLFIPAVLVAFTLCTPKTTQTKISRSPNEFRFDQYKLGEYSIDVSFFDPSEGIVKKYQLYETYSVEKRCELWETYLHNSALYLFEAKNSRGKTERYYCMRGNPEKINFAKFHMLEYIKPDGLDLQRPDRQNYAQNVLKREDLTTVGGFLYENMKMFAEEDAKKYIGNDVIYLGRTFWVVPYKEIKETVSKLIAEDLKIAGTGETEQSSNEILGKQLKTSRQ